jgi:hypothetical protein
MLGRQFTLPPEIALRLAGSLSGYQGHVLIRN